MKKILGLFLTLMLLVVFVACKGDDTKKLLEEAKEDLTIEFTNEDDDFDSVTEDLVLKTKGKHDVTITWKSSDTNVIANDGKVTRPKYGEGDKEVTLKATLKLNDKSVEKEFILTVKEEEKPEEENEDKKAVEDVLKTIKAYMASYTKVETDFNLPVVGANDVEISWESNSDHIVVGDVVSEGTVVAKLSRPENGTGDATVKLIVTITKNDEEIKHEFTVIVAEEPPLLGGTIADVLNLSKGDAAKLDEVIVFMISTEGFYVYDETGFLYVYTSNLDSIKVGDKISVKGTYDIYFNQPELKDIYDLQVISSDNELPTPEEMSLSEILEYETTDKSIYARYLRVTGVVLNEGVEKVFLLDDDGNKFEVNKYGDDEVIAEFDGQKITINIVVHTFRTDSQLWRLTFMGTKDDVQIVELTDEEKIEIAKKSINLPSETDFDLVLPTSHPTGVTITWESSHEDIINPETGKVTLPETTTDVTLTATFTINDVTDTETYVVTVLDTPLANYTIDQAIKLEDSDEIIRVEGLVIANSGYGFVVYGNGHFGFAYTGKPGEATVGDYIIFKTKIGSYKGLKQLQNPEIIQIVSSDNELPEFPVGTLKQLADRELSGALVTVKVSIEGKYNNVYLIDPTDSEQKLEVYYKSTVEYENTQGAVLKQFAGKTITLPVVMYQDGLVLFLGGLEDIIVLDATVEDAIKAADGTNLIIEEALVIANSSYGYVIYADGVFGFVYTGKVGEATVGDIIKFSTTIGSFKGLKQLQKPNIIEVISSDNPLPDFVRGNVGQLLERELTGALVLVKVSIEGQYNNVYLTDGLGNKVEVYYKSTPDYEENEGAVLKALEGETILIPVVVYQDGLVLFLGTSEDITVATEEDQIEDAKANLDLEETEITNDITLPSSYLDVEITWESDNTDVIANDGTVTRPETGEADVVVTLTATLTIGDLTETKEFVVTVKADEEETEVDLIISEYYEGNVGNNKYLEIYNGTGKDVDLSEYTLERYTNGGTTPTVIQLEGILANGDVFVIANNESSIQAILDAADMLSTQITHNGDDAYVLKHNGVIIDSFGRVGEDPGDAWTANGVSTKDMVLVRKSTVTKGDTIIDDEFDPSVEWDAYDLDVFDYLGSHTIDA